MITTKEAALVNKEEEDLTHEPTLSIPASSPMKDTEVTSCETKTKNYKTQRKRKNRRPRSHFHGELELHCYKSNLGTEAKECFRLARKDPDIRYRFLKFIRKLLSEFD